MQTVFIFLKSSQGYGDRSVFSPCVSVVLTFCLIVCKLGSDRRHWHGCRKLKGCICMSYYGFYCVCICVCVMCRNEGNEHEANGT